MSIAYTQSIKKVSFAPTVEDKTELRDLETQKMKETVSAVFKNFFDFNPLTPSTIERIFKFLKKRIYGKALLLGTAKNEIELVKHILSAPIHIQKEISYRDKKEAFKIAVKFNFEEIQDLFENCQNCNIISDKFNRKTCKQELRLEPKSNQKNRTTMDRLGLMISKSQAAFELTEDGIEELYENVELGERILGRSLFNGLFKS